jgi:hypothetical protein
VCVGPPLSPALPLPPSLTTSSVVNQEAGDLPFIIDPRLRMPYSQSWNFGVQRELPKEVLMEVNYIGSRGTRLLRIVDGNPSQPKLVAQLEAFCVPTNPGNTVQHAHRAVLPINSAIQQSLVWDGEWRIAF